MRSRNWKVWSSELKNVASKISQNVHGSEVRQPFGLFSMTFQDLGLIPWLSRPGNIWILNSMTFHDFPWSVCTLYLMPFLTTASIMYHCTDTHTSEEWNGWVISNKQGSFINRVLSVNFPHLTFKRPWPWQPCWSCIVHVSTSDLAQLQHEVAPCTA